MYCSVNLVRELSGLQNTTKISSQRISGKIVSASSMVDGALAYRYVLPISFHRKNTLTFAGTGTGSGTLSIVINGVTYEVAVTTSLTASQAADLFRDAVYDNGEFVTDVIGSGAVVTITSVSTGMTEGNSEVNISSASDGNGITTTIGTRENKYPPILEQLTAEIATALLLQDEFGLEAEGTSRDGYARMNQCQDQLKRLQGSKEPWMRVMDEITRTELTQASKDDIRYLDTDPILSIDDSL